MTQLLHLITPKQYKSHPQVLFQIIVVLSLILMETHALHMIAHEESSTRYSHDEYDKIAYLESLQNIQ
jgi:hypothetical protein